MCLHHLLRDTAGDWGIEYIVAAIIPGVSGKIVAKSSTMIEQTVIVGSLTKFALINVNFARISLPVFCALAIVPTAYDILTDSTILARRGEACGCSACFAVSRETRFASTDEASIGISAVGIDVAIIRVQGTFINVLACVSAGAGRVAKETS